ncbi:MAG: S9 family peptidase, partial [Pseudomonadota bacterium]|nr:S9 family peptidase [Pseudomonadota bacterium]
MMAAVSPAAAPVMPPPGLEAALSYPFIGELVAAAQADRVAWIVTTKGVRNIWTATSPSFRAIQLTRSVEDDGQELTGLQLSPDGARATWVRGGDHDANWQAEGGLQPNPASATDQPKMVVWSVTTAGGAPTRIDEGDAPEINADGRIAYIKDGAVWSANAAGVDKPQQLFADKGKDSEIAWSPDGTRL